MISGDDVIKNDSEYLRKQKQARLVVIEKHLQTFKDEFSEAGYDFDLKKDAAHLINERYWNDIVKVVKKHLQPKNGEIRANIYKICSCTELAIIYHTPIVNALQKELDDLNSKLAFHVSLSMLHEFYNRSVFETSGNSEFDKEIVKFEKEHLLWLKILEPDDIYPIFSNSQTWRLYDYLIRPYCEELPQSQNGQSE